MAGLIAFGAAGAAWADDDGDQPNPNCSLVVPADPLSAAGLATPYRLTSHHGGRCRESNTAQSAFVEAAILDPASGQIAIYRPLVVDKAGAAAPPVPVSLPAGAVVGIWFGFQGTTLTLDNASGCVNGLTGSPFGQFAYCNAPAFFRAAHAAIAAGKLNVPPLGVDKLGQPCPTTRDFAVVDQDQSDNLDTTYRSVDGRIAQDAGQQDGKLLSNASDNSLLDDALDPVIGCHPWMAPDLTSGGRMVPALALNELQASEQGGPVALVPTNDPMTLDGKHMSIEKTNLYRAGVDQPPLSGDTGREYCADIRDIAPARLRGWEQFTRDAPSPVPTDAKNLADFLQMRLKTSLKNLKCRKPDDSSGHHHDDHDRR
jgi:hypothetical protein